MFIYHNTQPKKWITTCLYSPQAQNKQDSGMWDGSYPSEAAEADTLGTGWQTARPSQLHVPHAWHKICIFTDLQNAFIIVINNSVLSPQWNEMTSDLPRQTAHGCGTVPCALRRLIAVLREVRAVPKVNWMTSIGTKAKNNYFTFYITGNY